MVKLDLTYLEILSEDDDEFKKEYLETFHSNYTNLTDKMLEELKKSDFDSLGKTAHQLKPTAKMIQLPCSDELEAFQHKPEEATKERILAVRHECEDAFNQLKKWANL